ncbi:MAG: FG-GAP repeat protein [Actinomycetota bacterium]
MLYGSEEGLRGVGSQLWHEGSSGVPGKPIAGDLFGFALASGDLDADGFADLAIGSPFDDPRSLRNAGSINVLYGSTEGLQVDRARQLSQDTVGLPDFAEEGDRFGHSLAATDLNADGFVDLGVGLPGESLPAASGIVQKNAGGLQVLFGGASGLTTSGAVLLSQASRGVPDDPEPGDGFGSTIEAGDLDGDAHGDVMVGAPSEDVGGAIDAGATTVIPGADEGVRSIDASMLHQGKPGVAERPEGGDLFGWTITVGDLSGDGRDELVVGVHGEGVSGVGRAGAMHVFPGAEGGVSRAGSALWHQDVEGVEGTAGNADAFGKALAAGDLNGDGLDDLAVGARYDDEGGVPGAGVVHVLYGSPTGLTTTGSQLWNQGMTGSDLTGDGKDHFGNILAIASLRGDAIASLLIGAHFESYAGHAHAGVLHVLPGAAGGVTVSGTQLWTQDSTDVPEEIDGNDFFPFSLTGH